jgi:hypothetical protein
MRKGQVHVLCSIKTFTRVKDDMCNKLVRLSWGNTAILLSRVSMAYKPLTILCNKRVCFALQNVS